YAAIKKWCYEEKKYTLKEMLDAIRNNWKDNEVMRQFIINNTPHFGNDDPYVDDIAHRIHTIFRDKGMANNREWHSIGFHSAGASHTAASLDGRRIGDALCDGGMSPKQGYDISGPTAVIKSATNVDPEVTNYTQLLNMKLSPIFLSDVKRKKDFLALLETFFNRMGHQVQFNVVDQDTLKAAQKKPDDYKDLLVRVAGFSHYFTELEKGIQDEIILRTVNE
ncbi:MAG: hypothetical protein M1308_16900, partial [Actinobacteria bacterium]|nr:hypothetical protein [Actinomycetota bacterium]